VALLGKNGMGKTTLMKTAIGFLKPWRGAIEFEGRDLTRLAPHDIAASASARAGEPAHLPRSHRAREPRAWACRRRRGARPRCANNGLTGGFPALSAAERAARAAGQDRSPAASSRCWRSPRHDGRGAGCILMDEPTQGLAPAFIRHIRA